MDKALKIAEELLGNVTKTEEEPDCFIFYNEAMEYDGVIVILKKNHRIMSMTEYIMRKEAR